jgi:hypothetical protein
MTEIKKNKAGDPKENHNDPGKNDAAKQEQDSQKNQHRENAPLEHLDDFALLTRQSPGAIKIQPVKNRRPDDQDNEPGDHIVW